MRSKKAVRKTVARLRTAKLRRRRELAGLPLEEKYEIVSHLQRISREYARSQELARNHEPDRRRKHNRIATASPTMRHLV